MKNPIVAWLLVETLTVPAQVNGAWAPSERTGAPEAELRHLAARLELTREGVQRWQTVLTSASERPDIERLLVLQETGTVIAVRDGDESSVAIGSVVDALLLRSTERLVLLHNHPHSVGLSDQDLSQLAKPGVVAIGVIGHDGSVYLASRAAQYDPDHFQEQYARVYDDVFARVRRELATQGGAHDFWDSLFSHIVCEVLARTEVIAYHATLASSAETALDSHRLAVARVVLGSAARLRARLRIKLPKYAALTEAPAHTDASV